MTLEEVLGVIPYNEKVAVTEAGGPVLYCEESGQFLEGLNRDMKLRQVKSIFCRNGYVVININN